MSKALTLFDNVLHVAFALLVVLDVVLIGYAAMEEWLR